MAGSNYIPRAHVHTPIFSPTRYPPPIFIQCASKLSSLLDIDAAMKLLLITLALVFISTWDSCQGQGSSLANAYSY